MYGSCTWLTVPLHLRKKSGKKPSVNHIGSSDKPTNNIIYSHCNIKSGSVRIDRPSYNVQSEMQMNNVYKIIGFFTIGQFDTFLSDYLTDLKLHSTK